MRTTRLLLCVAGLLALAPPAMAQPTEQEPAPAPGEQQQAAETPDPPPDTPAEAEPQDPFEYEATEQISEDLSVSFPVDI